MSLSTYLRQALHEDIMNTIIENPCMDFLINRFSYLTLCNLASTAVINLNVSQIGTHKLFILQ